MKKERIMSRKLKTLILMLAFSIVFTSIPIVSGTFGTKAAGYWGNFKLNTKSTSQVDVSWTTLSKAKQKKITGIAVYRDNKLIKKVDKTKKTFKDTSVNAKRTHKYVLTTYKETKIKQYYNSKTRKWQNKKPATKYWKKCPTGKYKGKKTRNGKKTTYSNKSVVKYSSKATEVFGRAIKDDEVLQEIHADLDPWFTNSSLPSSAIINLITQNTARYNVDSKGTVTWKSSDSTIATLVTQENGQVCDATFKKAGTVKLTATSSLNSKSKTITVTVKGASDSTVTEPSSTGITVPGGTVYPNANGEYDLSPGTSYDVSISNVDVNFSSLPTRFPSGTVFNINASEMVKNISYDGVDATSQSAYDFGSTKITNISNKNAIIDTDAHGVDSFSNGVFFVNAGSCDISFANGKTFTFKVQGKNNAMYRYREYIRDFVSNNSSKTQRDYALAAIKECHRNFKYGPVTDPLAMVTSSAGGNCFAKAKLTRRLLAERGINSYEHITYFNGSSGRHMTLEIIIGGEPYYADPTNHDDLYTEIGYETQFDANIFDNRIDSLNLPKLL